MGSSILTTAAAVASNGLGFYAGLAVTLILIILLATKLLADSYGSPGAKSLSHRLNVPVALLLVAFGFVIGFRLISLLS
ncbi:MAG: hypothetical protein M1319_03230 [Chloroflexi bacterium]|nr:hypothetical protein [Chloroflexota bacterium]